MVVASYVRIRTTMPMAGVERQSHKLINDLISSIASLVEEQTDDELEADGRNDASGMHHDPEEVCHRRV